MVDLSDLIARVEAASGPDRELDILVGAAVDLLADDDHLAFRKSFEICGMKEMLRMAESHQCIWRTVLPRYSASIDAALTLMPEGAGWLVGSGRTRPDEPIGGARITSLDGETIIAEAEAATPCLAMLSAILKARQASNEGARK